MSNLPRSTREQTLAFISFRMWDENTSVPKKKGHPHFNWPSDRSCNSQALSQLSTKLAEVVTETIYSLQITVYSAQSLFSDFFSINSSPFHMMLSSASHPIHLGDNILYFAVGRGGGGGTGK